MKNDTWFDKLTMYLYHLALVGFLGGVTWTIAYYLILVINMLIAPLWLATLVFFILIGVIFHSQIDEAMREYEAENERDLDENS